jgi:hypothetical protein
MSAGNRTGWLEAQEAGPGPQPPVWTRTSPLSSVFKAAEHIRVCASASIRPSFPGYATNHCYGRRLRFALDAFEKDLELGQ